MGRAYNGVMIGALLLAVLSRPVSVAEFDGWAQKRDVAAIAAHADPSLADKFNFLKGVGSFGVGRAGWRADEIVEPVGEKRYVVFTTALTTQDYGDQVFEWDGEKLTKMVHERETRGVELRKAAMEIHFDVPQKSTSISAKIDLEKTGTTEDSFFVRLGDNYKVSVAVDEQGNPVKFSQAGGVVCLPMGSSKEFSYTLVYSGVVNRPRFAGAIVDDEVMLTNDYWWPHIARLPMKLTTTTFVPKDWTVIGQGDKFAERLVGDQKVVTFVNEMPVCYMSLSAGKFGYREREVNGIKYFVASRELTNEQMDDQLEFFPPVIEFFSNLTPHPYSVYGAVDTRLYGGGALEAYSYATYGTGWLPAEDAHEPSHTWWGGLIPNTYFESFWNESFAVFSEGFYAREGKIGDRAEKRKAFVSTATSSPAYNQETPFTAGAEDGSIASTMGYGKGGDVLQQLEFEMGTPKMTEVLKKWLASHEPGEPGNWEDFEAICGSEWKWFFDQWIRGKGWPVLELGELAISSDHGLLTINQKAPGYRFKLEVAIKEKDEWRFEQIDVRPNSEGTAQVRISLPNSWSALSLDPFDRLLQPRRVAAPWRWNEANRRMRVFDPTDLMDRINELESMPDDFSNVLLVGRPKDIPQSAQYWERAGVVFGSNQYSDNIATYKGITVNLDHGAVVAVVEFEQGKFVGLRAGRTKYDPNVGIASVAVVDEYGRFITGTTVPRLNGPLFIAAAK